jgi:diguanylate cyclase (GGDEF)-like protein/putative nucleotidyltransferase with HDIG domain
MKTDVPPSSLFWNKILTIGFVSVPILLLRFSYVLTYESDRRPILRWGYASIVLYVVLAFTNNFTKSAEYVNDIFTYELAWGAYLFGLTGTAYTIAALVIMIRKTYKQEVPLRQVGLVIIGLAFVFIGGALNIIPTVGQYGIDILFNIFNAFLITFSIYRNKFLEINLIVKRGLSYSVYNIVLFAAYAIVIIISYTMITIRWSVTDTSQIVLFMAPVFLLMEPIRVFLQRLTRHIFYRGSVDRQNTLLAFSDIINSSLDLDKVTSSLATAIQTALEAKEVNIILKNANKYYLQTSTDEEIHPNTIEFSYKHPIIAWFTKGNKILVKTQIDNHVVFKSMWDSEKALIESLRAEVIVPIRYREELVGFIIISERNNRTPYSFEETEFLETIVNNAAAIIENAKTLNVMQKQSITDELTKLYNHRYFKDTTNTWIKESKYSRFGLVMVDVDQFKIYNDLYGHANGDEALRKIAEIITQVANDSTMQVRFGGEEFVVLYPNLSPEEVFMEAEKIRYTVEREFLLSSDIREFLTVTIGISNYKVDGETLEELITKADQAVLRGKQSGRNKTVLYQEDTSISSSDKQVSEKIKDAFVSSIYALAATIDAKDHYTYGHSNNVSELSVALAKKVGFPKEEVEIVRNAGLLHDIGKVGIPESVLSKPGFLTDQEYEIMKGHVTQSINIIKHIPSLIETVPVVISHHERWDGKGYPRGIYGENIPILGRVICIADAFDAMTTDRPYRKGLSLEQAIYELKKNSGTQFDPTLVDVFIDMAHNGELNTLKLENRPSFGG